MFDVSDKSFDISKPLFETSESLFDASKTFFDVSDGHFDASKRKFDVSKKVSEVMEFAEKPIKLLFQPKTSGESASLRVYRLAAEANSTMPPPHTKLNATSP